VTPWQKLRDASLLLSLTAGALLVHGYHFGVEDMAVYLPAIKKILDPALYPYDANFFLLYIRWTQFHSAVAWSVHALHLPLNWAALMWHVLGIFLVLLGCLRLARCCFAERTAQWAGVTLVAVLLTLPVSGTALFLVDQYLHPRTLATAFLLFALVAVLDRRPVALLWIFLAGLCHPTMALYGVFHLAVQVWAVPAARSSAILASPIPLSLPANPIWKEVMSHRDFQYPLRWRWYEWLGVAWPIVLLLYFARLGRRDRMPLLGHVSQRLAVSTTLGVLGAVVVTTVPSIATLTRLEPMRVLHFTYMIFVLFAGSLVGRYILRGRPWRWLMLFLSLSLAMFYAQRREFPASPHIEWPGRAAGNPWLQSFEWVRQNTPRGALFALDPVYLQQPGEDYHGFRGLAERSMLADTVKDPSVVEVFPDLAYQWKLEVSGEENWKSFRAADFQHLKKKYGVNWVILEQPGVPGLSCPYANAAVRVCRLE
jgi:hypothetical protein